MVNNNPLFRLSATEKLIANKVRYLNQKPFPYIVIDDFLPSEVLENILQEFPSTDSDLWHRFHNKREIKLGSTKEGLIPQTIRSFLHEFNSGSFLEALEEVTGIPNLIADTKLEGGGIHQIEAGGKLGMHIDFNQHPHNGLIRRLNLLIYLNKDWKEEYGGCLELWDRETLKPFEKIIPAFNRAVLFETSKNSLHGHPEPLTPPPGKTRKSIALYYYTSPTLSEQSKQDSRKHTTLFFDSKSEQPSEQTCEAINNFAALLPNGAIQETTLKLTSDLNEAEIDLNHYSKQNHLQSRDLFFLLVKKLNILAPKLIDLPFTATEESYSKAKREFAASTNSLKIAGLKQILAFGSKTRWPGVSDIDTALIVNDDFTAQDALTLEAHCLKEPWGKYFFHRPGLIAKEGIPVTGLIPLWGIPESIWGKSSPETIEPISAGASRALSVLHVTNYMALTGLSEAFEMWAGTEVSVRLVLAKLASFRHTAQLLAEHNVASPKSWDELSAVLNQLSQINLSEWQSDSDLRFFLLYLSALWFECMSETIETLWPQVLHQYFQNDSAKNCLHHVGQLSETKLLLNNWNPVHAAENAVASIKARHFRMIMVPSSFGFALVYLRQFGGKSLLGHLAGRVFYPAFIEPSDDCMKEALNFYLKTFENNISFLNSKALPYGLFHPYGVFLSSQAPINPWATL